MVGYLRNPIGRYRFDYSGVATRGWNNSQ